MAIKATFKDKGFGVGDSVKLTQEINEKGKKRLQVFEGMVIKIKGHGEGKSITLRRIGAAQVGIEKIFPLNEQVIHSIEVIRPGVEGVRHAKLYYTRDQHKREVEKIYSRQRKKQESRDAAKKSTKKSTPKKLKPTGKSSKSTKKATKSSKKSSKSK